MRDYGSKSRRAVVGLERKGQMGESNRHNLLTDRIWEVGDKKDSTGPPRYLAVNAG